MYWSTAIFPNAFVSNPFVIWANVFLLVGLEPFAMLPDIFTFVAFIVLLDLTVNVEVAFCRHANLRQVFAEEGDSRTQRGVAFARVKRSN